MIHVEQLWQDNPYTLEGTHLHQRADETGPRRERRGDLVILRGLALRSADLGLIGRADVIELHRSPPSAATALKGELPKAIAFDGLDGVWTPFPVDYKRGRPKANRCDEVQLCAQGLCLEEMLHVHVPEGALFYGKQQRRHAVDLDTDLRDLVRQSSERLHEIVRSAETPRAVKQPKCRGCSLVEICMPRAMTRRSASGYLRRLALDAGAEEGSL